jgi:hypothetical protein
MLAFQIRIEQKAIRIAVKVLIFAEPNLRIGKNYGMAFLCKPSRFSSVYPYPGFIQQYFSIFIY